MSFYPTKQLLVCSLVCSVLMGACKKPIDANGFDTTTWLQDTNGCASLRAKLVPAYEEIIKPQLRGASQDDVEQLLGKPDRQELYKRNQKFFFYYLEKGKQCGDTTLMPARQLQIRFDGIGKVNEFVITYQNREERFFNN